MGSALDLYDGLSENAANPIVNNSSSVKFVDLETWYYKTQYDSQSSLVDTPIQCPFIGNLQQYPQMLIISVSNQLQGIALQGISGQGFSNICYKQNLIGAPVLWGQQMLSLELTTKQFQPVEQIIPKPKPQQAVYKQAPRAIPKDYVKQQQVASKQTVQKQAARALPKDFVKQQQAAKKQREKPAQPIKIVNKKQKYADKRRRHYQIKSQQKQLERQFRDQEFNMEMMEQEQLQAKFQSFESGLLPQERDILISNRLEIQQPVRYDLLSQIVEDKRANFKDEQIEYAVGNQQTAVTLTFFNNNITSPEDCDAFIERVYQHENGRLFKCGFDFRTVIKRSEVIIDPNYVGGELVEALYP
ncbi:MAG: hypothetical protein EZS28_008663 [Streblomastix strix]|uniref:Uncharacterized protein n=1 Tax=Streblomastix strix TaxID=222440 RepID=A0A5J4WLQ9_9EUKA|nr:MAG: hypothetical protein EZS28_008663 [Streblomastix strix]